MDSSDFELFQGGNSTNAYEFLGAKPYEEAGVVGYRFAVWAPHAKQVSVVGSFNNWDWKKHPMKQDKACGIWHLFIPKVTEGETYKYYIKAQNNKVLYKADPYAFQSQLRPETGSVTCNLDGFRWADKRYLQARKLPYNRPLNIYEVHLSSWKQHPDGRFYTYTELAEELIPYVKDMGFTHIELMPVSEYPYDPSWGYQVTGFYSVTSRYGSPKEFMYFVNDCHKAGIGVILDWVPAHFPKDAHGLAEFDGAALYEYSDPKIGEHYEWGTKVFNYKKNEVVSFLISNAHFWFDKFHIDGLRVDAVSSMLYRDYNRKAGEWSPNEYGGRENIEAIEFLRKLNISVFAKHEKALMIAEESTAWPSVTKPVYDGGLGFNFKWNMGWMHDTLNYFMSNPYFRKNIHHTLTFSMYYAFSENYILPLSHDEVVHGKKSLLDKMSGEYEDKFAQLRSLYAYMYAHPGKKLIFMGGEFGQFIEWRYDSGLDWLLLDYEPHRKLKDCVRELGNLYQKEQALWENDNDWNGFRWINSGDYLKNSLSFVRSSRSGRNFIVTVCNFSGTDIKGYAFGVPKAGQYEVIFHSSNVAFGGKEPKKMRHYQTTKEECDGFENRLTLDMPAFSTVYLKKLKKTTK